MDKKIIGLALIGATVGSGICLNIRENPLLEYFPGSEISRDELDKTQTKVIDILGNYPQKYADILRGECTLWITGKSRNESPIVTLICDGMLVIQHEPTQAMSGGDFTIRVDHILIEDGRLRPSGCTTMVKDGTRNTTCPKNSPE